MRDYLNKIHIRALEYMANQPILVICMELLRPEGIRESKRWLYYWGTREFGGGKWGVYMGN